MSTPTTTPSTNPTSDVTKDNFIPIFSNKTEHYKEWRQRIQLYYKKMTLLNKKKEATINLLTSLTGIAWRQIEHVSDKLCDEEDGFTKAIQMLDACFQYDERVEMPRALERFFYQLQRRPDQTLLAYTSEHREQLREIEKYNIKLPASVSGWLMLRRSGLTPEQRQMVQSQCGTTLDVTKVEAAMFFLFGQDYRNRQVESSSRWTGGKGHSYRWTRKNHAYAAYDDWDGENDYEYFPDEVYHLADEEAPDYDWDDGYDHQMPEEEAPWPDDDGEPTFAAYDEGQGGDDDDYDEAYATYLDARRRFADIRAARGYWPVVAVPPGGATPTSSTPMSSSSPRPKGKGKGSKGKSGKGQRPFYQKGSASARAQAAPQCLKCGQSGHWSSECPSKSPGGSTSPSKRIKTTEGYVYMVSENYEVSDEAVMEEVYVTTENYVDQRALQHVHGIMDNGASSVLVGHNTLMELLHCLHLRGFDVATLRFRSVHKMFHFGGDASSLSLWCVHLPVTVGQQHGRIQVFIVEGDTPLLLGRPLLAFFNLKVDYANDLMMIGDSECFPAHRGARGEYLLQLTCNTFDGTDFDLMTDDVIKQTTSDPYFLDYDTVNLHQYLEHSNLQPPDFAYQQHDTQPPPTDSSNLHLDNTEDPSSVYKPITNKLLKTISLHHNMEQHKQQKTVEQALRAHDRDNKQFWEVYSGSGHLSKAMQNLGYQVRTFDLNNGWDLTIHGHRKKFMKLLRQECPDFVWLAPPCTIWSPLQELTPRTQEQHTALLCERDYQEHVHLKFTRRVFEEQARDDRDAGVEQPARAKSWKTTTFRLMANKGWMAMLDQCAFGATLPDNDGVDTPIKKPTALCLTQKDLARDLSRPCPGDHRHLPIEGSSPGVGNRAKASATYQPQMCKEIARQIHYHTCTHRHTSSNNTESAYNTTANEEPPSPQQPETSPDEQHEQPPPSPPPTGILQQRLQPHNNLMAQRTIQRLHRNLGHPTAQQLHKLLVERNANDRLLTACLAHRCQHCDQRRAPPQVPKSGLYKGTFFNDRVQADTLWLKLHTEGAGNGKKPRAVPILVISDTTTRFAAARLLPDETAKSFVQALERAWVRHFGTMKTLQVDEHRSWSSDTMKDWTSQHSIQLMISPGQAHERLAILERRHHVIRRALELFLMESRDFSAEGIIQAINYVLLQVNRMPNVQGYSPLQWTLGYNPHVPGLLMEENLQLPQLHPTQAFRQKLTYQSTATQVIAKANNDERLRRALLRQHVGNQSPLSTGDLCYYWRDSPHQGHAGPKILWRGPATVVMMEQQPHEVLWLAHGTSLIRAAPEHVKPLLEQSTNTEPAPQVLQPLQRARQALDQIRGRGVTQYVDLTKTNKRKRHEVDTEDEADDLDSSPPTRSSPVEADSWQVSTDGQTWIRVHRLPRDTLYCPTAQDLAPMHMFSKQRVTEPQADGPGPNLVITDDWTVEQDKTLGYTWTGTTTFTINPTAPDPDSNTTNSTADSPSIVLPQPSSLPEPSDEQHTTTTTTTHTTEDTPQLGIPAADIPEVLMNPQVDDSYRPQPDEDFQAKRARLDRQETITYRQQPAPPQNDNTATASDNNNQSFQPQRQQHSTTTRAAPYGSRPIDDQALYQDVEVDAENHVDTLLPPGWHIDNDGYIVLDDVHDEWQLKGNYLVRKHYIPRQQAYTPTQDTCPVPLTYLTNKRSSKMTNNTHHDSWSKSSNKQFEAPWTGSTEFKIQPAYRKLAQEHFYSASEGYTTYVEKKKNNPSNLSERSMSLADRLLFMEAKRKELRSFFENDVWTMVDENRAEPQRVLKAHFILKWSTNADGSPRAKARLITQGFRDPDAWSGALRTNSPTLTRLSRGMILSICSCMSWCPFTSDISTAFLQGKAHSKERTLWIRLPRDARQLLGMKEEDNRVMQLHKPMYGLCDAPRAWYMEAVDRILSIPNVVRHPLDACLFMVYDPSQAPQLHLQAEHTSEQHSPGKLVAMFGIHVDDLLGCGDTDNQVYQEVKQQLHKLFSFRMWEETKNLQYCGCDIQQHDDNITLQQTAYLHKQKPITITPQRKAQQHEPLNHKETTQLRALIGSLQWPSTQSAPHLQCAVSQLAGKVSKGTVSSLELGNKVLRMAKANADVGLHYHALGDVNDITFLVFSDATYASRDDLSSQGGYLLCMVHHDVVDGNEGFYNVLDWRSWKLARVARSSLSAESQAASESADALLFTCLFWKLIFHPHLPLEDSTSAQLRHRPAHVIDAKALYDLLTKDEIQASIGADKRTAVETLVAQDKLRVCQAHVRWVSSERQYADGMTKTEASQLLADRLRTHRTKLISDESFQASKKKTPQQRKQAAEMFATKRTSKALTALAMAASTTQATATYTDNSTQHTADTNFTATNLVICFLTFLDIVYGLALLPVLSQQSLHYVTAFMNKLRQHYLEVTDWLRGPDRPEPEQEEDVDLHLEFETQQEEIQEPQENVDELVRLHQENQRLEEELQRLTAELTAKEAQLIETTDLLEINRRLASEHHHEAALAKHRYEQLQNRFGEILEERLAQRMQNIPPAEDVDALVNTRINQLIRRPVHFAQCGEVWHFSRRCVQQRTSGQIITRRPCSWCAHDMRLRDEESG